jgi:hypothetical protein
MSEETRTNEVANITNSEVIDQTIAEYLIDVNVIAPLFSYRSLAGEHSKTKTFTRWDKDTAVDVTEADDVANEDMTLSENAITVAQVAIHREITEFAKEVNILGPEGLMRRAVEDGIALCKEAREDDMAGLFVSLTGTTIGSTGVDLSVANFIEAISRLRTAKVPGPFVCVLDDQQALDLMQGIAAVTGSVWSNEANQSVMHGRSDGYLGAVLTVPTWYTNLTDTTNTAADVVGGMWADPATNDAKCAMALVELWAPRSMLENDTKGISQEITIYTAYGTGVKYGSAGVPIITDA